MCWRCVCVGGGGLLGLGRPKRRAERSEKWSAFGSTSELLVLRR